MFKRNKKKDNDNNWIFFFLRNHNNLEKNLGSTKLDKKKKGQKNNLR